MGPFFSNPPSLPIHRNPTYQGIGNHQNLPCIGWIRQGLRISHHPRVEDHLPGDRARRTKGKTWRFLNNFGWKGWFGESCGRKKGANNINWQVLQYNRSVAIGSDPSNQTSATRVGLVAWYHWPVPGYIFVEHWAIEASLQAVRCLAWPAMGWMCLVKGLMIQKTKNKEINGKKRKKPYLTNLFWKKSP